MAVLAVPWKVRMAAVSEGGTGGVVAITAQISLQQLIHTSSENSKGSKLHPMSSPFHLSSTTLLYFPFSLVGGAWSWPQSQFLIPGMVTLYRLLPRLQWISPMFPSRASHLQAAPALLMELGAAGPFPALSLPKHNGDPLKEPPLHLCLSASALWKKINIAVCC